MSLPQETVLPWPSLKSSSPWPALSITSPLLLSSWHFSLTKTILSVCLCLWSADSKHPALQVLWINGHKQEILTGAASREEEEHRSWLSSHNYGEGTWGLLRTERRPTFFPPHLANGWWWGGAGANLKTVWERYIAGRKPSTVYPWW